VEATTTVHVIARQANGDCFAYAQAKSARAALLFKGEDFSRTDAESAA
jgi:uncharacterized protein with PIN domain